MPIDLDDGDERDDLALVHPLTPSQRLATIAEILAAGVGRRRDDRRRMGEFRAPHRICRTPRPQVLEHSPLYFAQMARPHMWCASVSRLR